MLRFVIYMFSLIAIGRALEMIYFSPVILDGIRIGFFEVTERMAQLGGAFVGLMEALFVIAVCETLERIADDVARNREQGETVGEDVSYVRAFIQRLSERGRYKRPGS